LALLIWSIVSGVRYSAQRREPQRLREQMLEQERRSRQEVYDDITLVVLKQK